MQRNHENSEAQGKWLKILSIAVHHMINFISLFSQPKTITHREAIQYLVKYDHVTMYVGNGNICLECDSDFEEHSHIT